MVIERALNLRVFPKFTSLSGTRSQAFLEFMYRRLNRISNGKLLPRGYRNDKKSNVNISNYEVQSISSSTEFKSGQHILLLACVTYGLYFVTKLIKIIILNVKDKRTKRAKGSTVFLITTVLC